MVQEPTTFDNLVDRIPDEYRGDFITLMHGGDPSPDFLRFMDEDAICQATVAEAASLMGMEVPGR